MTTPRPRRRAARPVALLASLVLALALGACGDDEEDPTSVQAPAPVVTTDTATPEEGTTSPPVETTAPESTSTAPEGGAEAGAPYPEESRDAFLQACTRGSASEAFCECALTSLEERVPFEEFRQIDEAARQGGGNDPRVTEILASCATQG